MIWIFQGDDDSAKTNKIEAKLKLLEGWGWGVLNRLSPSLGGMARLLLKAGTFKKNKKKTFLVHLLLFTNPSILFIFEISFG